MTDTLRRTPYWFSITAVESPAEHRARSARGGLTNVAKYGGDVIAARARAGQRERRIDLIDPARRLPPDILEQRLQALVRAHAMKMVEARQRNRHLRDTAPRG